jgi:gamma-glutamyltranspeptidase / glutathione hydrolase
MRVLKSAPNGTGGGFFARTFSLHFAAVDGSIVVRIQPSEIHPMRTVLVVFVALLTCNSLALGQSKEVPGIGWHATGKQGAVSAGGAEAVAAGLATLKAGGNAIDGAVATIFAMTVTESDRTCFGGEVPFVIYDAKRNVVEVVCGLGTAPRLATREYFANKKGGIPGSGLMPAAIPALVDGCLTALDRYGTITFADAIKPTLVLLDRKEKPWHSDLARTIRRMIDAEKQSPNDRKRGLRLVADFFYRGPLAKELDQWMRDNGGLIRYTDLATHVTRVEDPASANYRGHTVYKCGFWNQGPYLLQTLQMLEGYDLKAMGHNRPDTIHVMTEAMKLALADRDVYYADPLFADVPAEALLSKKYADLRRPLIDMKKASQTRQPGDPHNFKALLDQLPAEGLGGDGGKDTTSCVVADKFGNIVAATPSGFAGVTAGKTGVTLGVRLQSFNIWKGHPNCIEPGKRPRITLSPGLVFKDGKPILAFSAAGGDQQDQTALQVIINHIDFGMEPKDAVTAPRFATNHLLGSFRQTPPVLGSLLLYPEFPKATFDDLTARGHKITTSKRFFAEPSVITIDQKTGVMRVAGDPRPKRHAAAY